MRRLLIGFAVCFLAAGGARGADGIFARSNLVAWCVVPFDAKKRGPEERAAMLEGLGIRRLAYDWRAEHIPTFDAEIDACRRRGIEITAWWFPTSLNEEGKKILEVLKRKNLRTQLWVMGGGEATRSPEEQKARVEVEVKRLRPIVEAAGGIGCQVGLYNHGGWFGNPENQIELIKALQATNVGIVYNFHHGHHEIEQFPGLLAKMKPYLIALNINGMVKDGDRVGKKILPVGAGDRERGMLEMVLKSGWRGPIGILNHREEMDAEVALRGNRDGLEKLLTTKPLQ